MIPSTALAVGESCDTRASECCAPPPIVVDGGGCPANAYWIGDAATGYCRPSATVCGSPGDAQNFSCMSGGCTGQAQTPPSNPSTPLCGNDSSKIHLGGADVNNCASKVTVIQDPSATTFLKAWMGQIFGNFVYIPTGTTCGTNDSPTWDSAQSKWTCAQGGGVWSKSGNDIANTNTGNVGIGTSAAPTVKLEVNGEIKGWGMVPVGTIISWYCPAATVNAANCNALLPSNWKICDGSTVSDAASPFNTKALPNLVDKFIRGGKADYTDLAGTGGTNAQTISITAHSHTGVAHTHTIAAHTHTLSGHTHTIAAHTHTVPSHSHTIPSHSHDLGNHTHSTTSHRHMWSKVYYPLHDDGDGWWYDGEGTARAGMSNGQDNGGGGIEPLSKYDQDAGLWEYYYTSYSSSSTNEPSNNSTSAWSGSTGSATATTSSDSYTTQGPSTDSTSEKIAVNTGSATAGTDSKALTTDSYDNQPAFLNFVKIIRIK